MDAQDVPEELERRLTELESLGLWLDDGAGAGAQRLARLRLLLAAVGELRDQQPVAVPAQRAPRPGP